MQPQPSSTHPALPKMPTYRKTRELPVVCILSCILSMPLFFDIFRNMAFNTLPRDDYAPFLLYFTSRHGTWPNAPFGYRFLSMLAAAPFYWLLPLVKFSLLPPLDNDYLRATEALAFLSYISIAASSALAFIIARERLTATLGQAGFAGLLMMVLSGFAGQTVIDPFGIFVIFLLVYILEEKTGFAIIIIAFAPFINEKILLFFLFLVASRVLFVPGFLSMHKCQAISTLLGILVYATMKIIIGLPGHEEQTSLTQWLPNIIQTLKMSVATLKGVQLNMIDSFVVILPCALFAFLSRVPVGIVEKSDFLVPLGLLAVACAARLQITVGHVVTYALPLSVMSSVALICQWDR